jgi:hypothetical protein
MLWLLEMLLKEGPGQLMVVWHNGWVHRRKDVTAFLRQQRRRPVT